MALPTTLSTVVNTVGDSSGPFISSAGNVYGLFVESSVEADNLAMVKATDPTTSFSAIGTNQTPASTQSIGSWDIYQVDDNLHVACQLQNGSVYYLRFSMASDSWTVTATLVDTSNAGVSEDGIGIVVDSSGVITILYIGDHHGSSRDSIYRARSTDSGASWGTPLQIDDNSAQSFSVPRIMLGESDTLHAVFVASQNIYQRAIDSSGAAQTFRDTGFDTAGSSVQNLCDGISFVRSSTTQIRVPYREVATADFEVLAFTSSADPSTFSTQNVDGTNNLPNAGLPAAIAADEDHVWSAFVRDVDDDIYRADDNAADSWDSITSNLTGSYSRIRANIYPRDGWIVLAYFAFDGTNQVYNEYQIRPAPVIVEGSGEADTAADCPGPLSDGTFVDTVWTIPDLNPHALGILKHAAPISGGASLNDFETAASSGNGFWEIVLGRIPVVTRAEVLNFRAIEAMLTGRVGVALLHFCDGKRAPLPTLGGPISAFAAGDFIPGDTSGLIEMVSGSAPIAGMHFSTDDRLYRITSVGAPTGNVYPVGIWPKARELIMESDELEFEDLRLRVRLKDKDAMHLILQQLRYNYPTVSFVEDVLPGSGQASVGI